MDALRNWLAAASAVEKKALVREAGISVAMLHAVLSGRRAAEADWAARVERAVQVINRGVSDDRLPPVTRADICSACAACPYAQKCLNK